MPGRWRELKSRTFTPEQLREIDGRVEKEILEMNLRELRELLGKTQEEMAELTKMSQGQVSMTERRQDLLLSTLRRYVQALGGDLECVAHFGNKRVRLGI